MASCKGHARRVFLPALLAAFLANGCSGPGSSADESAADLVIRGGRMLDMVSDQPNLTPIKGLVVSGGAIDRIILSDSAEDLPDAPAVVEAGTSIVMPGLVDSHIHFRPWASEGALHFGVTTVFDTGPCGAECGDDPSGFIIGHAKALNAPEANGPTMFYTGIKLDGPDGVKAIEVYRLQSLDEIPQKIEERVALGASGIKVEENLPPDYRRRIMEEANRRGLPVIGHSMNARESIDVGMKFIEHMDPITRVVARDPAKVVEAPDPADQMDFAKVPEFIQLMVKNEVYLNPTMVGRYGSLSPRAQSFYEEDKQLLETPAFAKVPPEARARYLERSQPAKLPPAEMARRRKGFENVQRFIREFSEAGGLLLAATDMGNSRMPGVSLYREMQMIVDSGVPPYKALLGATRYAAGLMKKTDLFGTLEAGKQADILVLGSNPADDVAAVKDIRYVIRKGKIIRAP